MKRHFVICVALVAACADHELKKMESARDEVCACKTVQCAETAIAQVPQKKVPSNTRSQKLAREMLDCLAELYQAARPTTDPDAPVEPAPAPAAPPPAPAP